YPRRCTVTSQLRGRAHVPYGMRPTARTDTLIASAPGAGGRWGSSAQQRAYPALATCASATARARSKRWTAFFLIVRLHDAPPSSITSAAACAGSCVPAQSPLTTLETTPMRAPLSRHLSLRRLSQATGGPCAVGRRKGRRAQGRDPPPRALIR